MKLSQWARRAGQLPVPAEQLPTGKIIVKEIKNPAHAAGLDGRCSRADKKKDLKAQLSPLVVYAENHRLPIVQAVSEVGSGLNGRRPKLIKLWPTRRSRPSWSSIATG